MTSGLQDSFYKITAKALGVAVVLLPRMRPDIAQPLPAPVRDVSGPALLFVSIATHLLGLVEYPRAAVGCLCATAV